MKDFDLIAEFKRLGIGYRKTKWGNQFFCDLPEIFDFSGGGSCPTQYEFDLKNCNYYLRYRHSWLSIDVNECEVFTQERKAEEDDGGLYGEHATVILFFLSEAIRRNDLSILNFPDYFDSAFFRKFFNDYVATRNAKRYWRGFELRENGTYVGFPEILPFRLYQDNSWKFQLEYMGRIYRVFIGIFKLEICIDGNLLIERKFAPREHVKRETGMLHDTVCLYLISLAIIEDRVENVYLPDDIDESFVEEFIAGYHTNSVFGQRDLSIMAGQKEPFV